MTIKTAEADWILDSRGNPTVEVVLTLKDGRTHRSSAPAGASKGAHERPEDRDDDSRAWGGYGVERAIEKVAALVSHALAGLDEVDQAGIDRVLRSIESLGSNSMVATSAAVARAGADTKGEPLWMHLVGERTPVVPLPMVNLFSGNLHAQDGMSIQDVLIVPLGARSLPKALEWTHDVYRAAGRLLRASRLSTAVGDEGGYATASIDSRTAIALAVRAIEEAGLEPGRDVAIALDVAATHLLSGRHYKMDGAVLESAELASLFVEWYRDFPIVSIEDPFAEDDWSAWSEFCALPEVGSLQILGDDLITTNAERLERAESESAANAVLVKANQIGTISDAMDVATQAARTGMRAVVSARSGETEDDWLADLAVAAGSGQIKIGSIARSERLAKYNRLLRISRDSALEYAGGVTALPA